jgi:hypothetical protein
MRPNLSDALFLTGILLLVLFAYSIPSDTELERVIDVLLMVEFGLLFPVCLVAWAIVLGPWGRRG